MRSVQPRSAQVTMFVTVHNSEFEATGTFLNDAILGRLRSVLEKSAKAPRPPRDASLAAEWRRHGCA